MLEDSDTVQLLGSGVVILTGGHGVTGGLILTIPANKLETLSEWSTEKLATLFLHFTEISKYLKSPKEETAGVTQIVSLACLADLRQASTVTLKQLTESLEAVEHQKRGTIGVVYFLKPRNKTRSRILKKLLGIKPSKKRPRIPLFKVVLMKTLQELHTYIDVSQLTPDFCGILRYNHEAWMHLYSVIIQCIEGCRDLLTKLPSVRDKIDLLQEYETDGHTSSQVQQLLADLIEKFHIILSESSLPLYLTLSKQTLFLLDHPSSDSKLSLVHPELISGLRSHLRSIFSQLDQWNTDLEDTWRVTESRLTVLIQVHRHRERAKEIERKICDHYHPLLREHPIVGKTLSQAELYRAHFTTTLYDPAKELLSRATEILEAVQRLKNVAVVPPPKSSSGRRDSTNTQSSSVISNQDISEISNCLTTSIQPFTIQLQQLQQVYVSIHIFHLLFEKALIWYKKVLKFIPESLLQRCTTDSELAATNVSSSYNISSYARECLLYMPSEWLGAVRAFLSRHPPPRQEHIDRIDESIPQLVDRKMRSQARSLALRLRLLQQILTSTRLPLKVVTAVLAWRAELFGPSQQEKVQSGNLHANLPAREMTNAGVPANQENQHYDKHSARGQPRPHATRAPEKPPRSRKMVGVDHTRTRPSSLLFGASAGGLTGDEMRGPEKPSLRKSSSKLVQRPKSVDFNFNSSSTDGSVFDYDKALVQAESRPDAVRVKAVPRKSRTSIKDSKPSPSHAEDLRTARKDEDTFSASGLLNLESRSQSQDGKSEEWLQNNNKQDYASEPGSEKSESGSLHHNFELREIMYESNTIPEPEPDSSASFGCNPVMRSKQLQQRKGKPFQINRRAVSPSSGERFIRVTFTPKQFDGNTKPAFRFSSGDLLKATRSHTYNEEEESGIDVTQGADPYDGVVNKIREISASALSNIEKLKKVSELLSLNTHERETSQKFLDSRKRASKMSVSTMDLRASDQDRNGKCSDLDQGEMPIQAVLRMKKNLAKSMEDLNLSCSYSQTNDANFSEQKSPAISESHGSKKRPSDLKIKTTWGKNMDEITDPRISSLNHIAIGVGVSKNVSRSKDSEGPHSWSDGESFSQGVSTSMSSHDPASTSKQSLSPFLDSSSNAANNRLSEATISRFLPDDSNPGGYPMDTVISVTRPASLNSFGSRNFISPSFLRPATSMKDLTNGGHPAMTFDVEVDLEQDYRALEDLEILQTMQEDHLSKEFSKYASRRHSNDHVLEKLQDEQRTSERSLKGESPSQSLMSGRKGPLHAARHESKSVPDIRVSRLFGDSPSFEDQMEDELPYLSAPDVNFYRLTSEADKEHLSQEVVAESLRKTQQILEEEETRRFQRLHPLSDPSLDDEDVDDLLRVAGGLSNTTSLDNGYGSWTSKLMHNTSSERDWRKLSTSSADSSAKLPRHIKNNKARDDEDEDDLEASDTIHELPRIEKPLAGPDLY